MTKNTKVVLVVIAIIAISLGWFLPTGKTVVDRVIEKVGAVPTLDGVDNPFVTINGQKEWRGTVSMMATSSVVCSIKNPLAATSSIDHVSAEVSARGGMGAANQFVISTSTGPFSTSTTNLVHNYAMETGLFSVTMAKNAATTTGTAFGVPVGVSLGMGTAGNSLYVLGPSEYVNFVVSTTTPGGGGTFASYMTGKCSLVLKKI